MIFLHGWRELGLIWRSQIRHFATKGWRCVAPDMCGYGRSSRPLSISAYCVRELVADMVKLQWDYWLYYREHFAQASQAFEVDVRATLSHLYRIAPRAKPACRPSQLISEHGAVGSGRSEKRHLGQGMKRCWTRRTLTASLRHPPRRVSAVRTLGI
jgi:hypothetical protein